MRVVVFTSSNLRHKAFAKRIIGSKSLMVEGVFLEKEKSINKVLISNEKSTLLKEHLFLRDIAERDFFEWYVNNTNQSNSKISEVDRNWFSTKECLRIVEKINPDIIMVYGTTIIKGDLIRIFEKRIINLHLGLSPYYRGAGTNFFPFVNNQPEYASEGYDCYVNNEFCQDYNNDGVIMDWIGDGYCDDGNWGLNFMCEQYSWDCSDCGGEVSDENGYCDDSLMIGYRFENNGRLPLNARGWEEDDDTNVDFAEQLNWDILDLPIYLTGGNFMTDGYGTGFSTKLMIN